MAQPAAPVRVPQPFPAGLKALEDVQGTLWARTLDAGVKVALTLDDRAVTIAAARLSRFPLRAVEWAPGAHTLELRVTNIRGQVVLRGKQGFEVER